MIKKTQLFGWDQEPAFERPHEFASSSFLAPLSTSFMPLVRSMPEKFERDPPTERDRTLSRMAVGWMDALPDKDRPAGLCRRYPRIANRLALCWADSALSMRVLDDLLDDKRGGRKGFPAEVAQELRRLATHVMSRSRR